ncbi:MAG: hypothetical protein BM564_00740 [Bacteroidetes bacterium MedPE-SWsnd-G2]|nr:MAG: hypothetical protein BM564_00740 [Bacteroidetes bacterium MedPE-SWsnd-G2]
MKTQILTILFSVIYVLGYTQNNEHIYPNFIGQELKSIKANSGWKVLQKASGDLNTDGTTDFALILESRDSVFEKRCSDCKLLKNKPRIIVVLLSHNSTLKTTIQNNKFIARGDEGGMMPYLEPELSIENGLLNIYYQYTRSSQSYTFKFDASQMVIIKAESTGVHSATGSFESLKYDFRKGELIWELGHISQDKTETKISPFDIKPKSLSEFEEMYEWEIIDHKLL